MENSQLNILLQQSFHQNEKNQIDNKQSQTKQTNNQGNKIIQNSLSYIQQLRIIFQYITSDIQKKPKSFKIGLFTIYVVVTFISFLLTSLQLSQLLFIQISEDRVGDVDLILSTNINSPKFYQNSLQFGPINQSQVSPQNYVTQLINSTQMDAIVANMSSVFGQSPRWLMLGNLKPIVQIPTAVNPILKSFCVLIDSKKEISTGLGRVLEVQPIENNQVYISQTILDGLGLDESDQLQLAMNLQSVFDESGILNAGRDSHQQNLTQLFINSLTQNLGVQFNQFQQLQAELQNFNIALNQQNYNNISSQQQLNIANNTKSNEIVNNQTYSLNQLITIYTEYITDSLNVSINLKAQKSISDPKGKWTQALGNVLLMDYHNFTFMISEAFSKQLNQTVEQRKNSANSTVRQQAEFASLFLGITYNYLLNLSQNYDLNNYALFSNIVLNNRESIYQSADQIKSSIISVSNQFYTLAGIAFPSQITTPLSAAIIKLIIIKVLFNQVVLTSIFILVLFSSLLIYSLMIGDAEEKTYEFGMLRALGFGKRQLIALLTIQALTFSLSGITIGFVSSYILNSLVCVIIFCASEMKSTYQLSDLSIYLSTLVGLLVPLISNVFPIQRVLSKQLRVEKLEKLGISSTQTILAILFVIMGFLCYYVAPLAIIFQNTSLFLTIIGIILIVVVIGVTFLAHLFQRPLQILTIKMMLRILVKDQILVPIVLQNMKAHENRNSKTSLIYTLSISFIIFTGTGTLLQTELICKQIQVLFGGDIYIEKPFVTLYNSYGLKEQEISSFLQLQNQHDPTLIEGYSFTTFSMNSILNPDILNLENQASFPSCSINLYGVQRYLMKSLNWQLYRPNQLDSSISFPQIGSSGKVDGVYGLFLDNPSILIDDEYNIITNQANRKSFQSNIIYAKGFNQYAKQLDRKINIIIPTGMIDSCALDAGSQALIHLNNISFRSLVIQTISLLPGFGFSQYQSLSYNAIIGINDFQYMLNQVYNASIENASTLIDPQLRQYYQKIPSGTTNHLPKSKLFIKFARPTTQAERIKFTNGIRNYINNEETILYDINNVVEATRKNLNYLQLFYIAVAIISGTIAFFLLLVSFNSNIKDNSWEFGVMRSIGLDKYQLTRIYIYEALGLIIPSTFIGSMVGVTIAVFITINLAFMSQLPFIFIFPTGVFIVTTSGGLISAVGASYLAVRDIRDRPINVLLKGQI